MPNVQIKVVTIPPASSGFIPFARVIHSKLMTIDDEIARVGTSNWTGGYLDNSRNLELVMHSAAMSGGWTSCTNNCGTASTPNRCGWITTTRSPPGGESDKQGAVNPRALCFTVASRFSPAPSPAARRSTLPPGGRCR